MAYKCDACRDAGFVHPMGENGKPLYDQVIACPVCGGFTTEFGKESGLKGAMTLESFDYSLPGVSDAFKAASDMAIGKADFIWLILHGSPGNGKTHLAKAVGAELMKRGKQVKYHYVPTLLADMRKGMDLDKYPMATAIENIVDEVCMCSFLILDDLGAENFTTWAGSRIEEIINRRYEANKELLVTTNKDLRALPQPILSRFKDTAKCRIVENSGGDFRKTKR